MTGLLSARPYDIEADWILLSTCNYRCQYCYWPLKKLGEHIRPSAPVVTLARFFDDSGMTWLVHITGGEPFIYPEFVDLCRRITQHHYVSLNTNLTSDSVAEFAAAVDPTRVSVVHCGLHIEQREQRREVPQFIARVHLLQRVGFHVMVSYVMKPSLFHRFSDDFASYLREGIVLFPKALQGEQEGLVYPASYTAEERALFVRYSEEAEMALQCVRESPREMPTINPLLDRRLVTEGLPDFRGRLCQAGQTFVRIRENGDIRRCGARDVLGNVGAGVFQPRMGPSVCNELECPYFCYKYALPDNVLSAERPLFHEINRSKLDARP